MFYSNKWLWKQSNSLLQLALKLCVTKRAVQRHAVWCVASDFAQKRCVADSTRKQRVSDLYKSRWKWWRLTNHNARIVMPVLQNGFWLANLQGRKSLSCIDFFLHKFKQNAVYMSVENYFTHRIPSYFLDTCTKKTLKRVTTIVIHSRFRQTSDKRLCNCLPNVSSKTSNNPAAMQTLVRCLPQKFVKCLFLQMFVRC